MVSRLRCGANNFVEVRRENPGTNGILSVRVCSTTAEGMSNDLVAVASSERQLVSRILLVSDLLVSSLIRYLS